ncbi:YdbC family protein [Enterococcus faecalis]|uniref:YdbC family protein n=1 Tax=Enterococcus faecalis TaxID=1351 RepID=UPI0040435032
MVLDLTKNQPTEQKKLAFEKTEQLAVLDRNGKGWTVELNKVSYDGREPVYDLRSWSPEGRMGKGLTLSNRTLENLLIALKAHLEGIVPPNETEETKEDQVPVRLPSDF